MEYINNGDSASSIRTKLNQLIDFYNANSTTTTTTTMMGGDTTTTTTTMAGGGGYGTATVWDNSMASPMGVYDAGTACSAIGSGYSHTVYISKGGGNMGGTDVPEVNDYLYENSALTTSLQPGTYWGYYDTAAVMNKYISVGPGGLITSVNSCA